MKKSDDQLAIFENRIRNNGVWCDLHATDKIMHKFVCKHPKAHTAISLCGQSVASFDKLHETTVKQKCLVCSLFEETTQERRLGLYRSLITIQDKLLSDNQPKQEK